MSVTLKSSSKKFFMSGGINLKPGQTITVDENTLTEGQLRDIIYNVEIKDLETDSLGVLQSRLSQLSSTGGGGGSTSDPITLKRLTDLENKVVQVEQEVNKPIVIPPPVNTTINNTIREELLWSTTDW